MTRVKNAVRRARLVARGARRIAAVAIVAAVEPDRLLAAAFVIGVATMAVGVALIYLPAGVIVSGALTAYTAVALRGEAKA